MRKLLQDRDLETAMGSLLRIGVILSSIIVTIGGVIYLYKHGSALPNYHTFRGNKGLFHTLPDIISGLETEKGQAIIQLGILVLILTPIARIIFSFIGFILEKDHLYTALTLLVLCIILFSLMTGTHA